MGHVTNQPQICWLKIRSYWARVSVCWQFGVVSARRFLCWSWQNSLLTLCGVGGSVGAGWLTVGSSGIVGITETSLLQWSPGSITFSKCLLAQCLSRSHWPKRAAKPVQSQDWGKSPKANWKSVHAVRGRKKLRTFLQDTTKSLY